MIESVTLELRPRLQICNAFIRLNKKVNSTKVEIKLSEKSIEVKTENNTVTFLIESIKLIPNSLSTLNITNNWVCFRAQTKCDSVLGSFKSQIITNSTFNINTLRDSVKNIKSFNANNYSIMCACCKNVLSKNVCIKRVLPVPDMNYEPSEWFCCKYNYDTIIHNLIPLESDIFYGSHFFIIHRNNFNETLKIDEDSIICNRCLQYLGKIHTDNSLKLWSYAVDYSLLGNSEIINATDPFNDFLIAITISVTEMVGEEIVLQCLLGKKIHSLILKPMDWHLNLMIEPKAVSGNNATALQKVSVAKVLYKYKISENASVSINKSYCEVGFSVMRAGLEHLLMSTKRFPQLHRVASDFYIGHIYLKDPISHA